MLKNGEKWPRNLLTTHQIQRRFTPQEFSFFPETQSHFSRVKESVRTG